MTEFIWETPEELDLKLILNREGRTVYECAREAVKILRESDRNREPGELLQALHTVYLKHNGSIQAVAAELYTHRNTVLYRIGNIRKILGNELKTPEERLPYQIAFYIRSMHGSMPTP